MGAQCCTSHPDQVEELTLHEGETCPGVCSTKNTRRGAVRGVREAGRWECSRVKQVGVLMRMCCECREGWHVSRLGWIRFFARLLMLIETWACFGSH
jgi:hypothetical protein